MGQSPNLQINIVASHTCTVKARGSNGEDAYTLRQAEIYIAKKVFSAEIKK